MRLPTLSNLHKNTGFTLIELLVVIAIIAILSTIGLSAFTSAQIRARDARRMGDIKAIQDSFEQYYNTNNTYLANCGAAMYASVQTGTSPLDPKLGTAYSCVSNATQYCACAALEGVQKGNATGGCNGGTYLPTWGVPTSATVPGFQCVRNLQ